MERLLVIGSSGHAKVILDIIEQEGRYEIAGLLDRYRQVGEGTSGYQVLGCEEDLPDLIVKHGVSGVIVASGDNFIRAQVAERVRSLCPTLAFASAVHPRACVARDAVIGEGTVIMAGATVNPACTLGRFCIVNTQASLDHDGVMEDFASLAPRATTGGNCRIGAYSAISIGAVVIHGMHIGEHTVIGAGSVVLKPVGARQLAYGVPAKVIRAREPGEKLTRSAERINPMMRCRSSADRSG
jgi:sugar O-acyltransferase (sialic acid O-acetyltransferase NeuD family)